AATFERLGYLARLQRGGYVAGAALIDVARSVRIEPLLVAAGRPVLEELAKTTGRTAHLGVLQEDMVTYLVKAGAAGADLFTREGMQLEGYCSGIGKVLLASLPDEARNAYLAAGPFVRLTSNTIVEPEALRRELDSVSTNDFAFDNAEVDEN